MLGVQSKKAQSNGGVESTDFAQPTDFSVVGGGVGGGVKEFAASGGGGGDGGGGGGGRNRYCLH